MVEERAYWVAWSQIKGVGAVLLKRLQQRFGSLAEAWNAPETALAEVEGFGKKLVNVVVETRSQLHPEQFLDQHTQKNPQFWTPADSDYPRLLLEIPSPPPVLYYRGQVNLNENQGITPMIAMVGTRSLTDHGKRWTRKISAILAKRGFTIISGLAAGIDTEAHWGCLEVGGRTIAVLGTGLDVVYPPQNRQLFQEIEETGLILSEYPVQTKAYRGNFPARNRIVAALSRAVLVMEAPRQSGALITAKYANEFGRDVYALPNSPDNYQSLGCLRLLNKGARGIEGEADLLEMLGDVPNLDTGVQLSLFETVESKRDTPTQKKTLKPEKTIEPLNLSPDLEKIYLALSPEATPFDLIVQTSEMNPGAVSGILLQLELMGLVSQLPGMRYQRNG